MASGTSNDGATGQRDFLVSVWRLCSSSGAVYDREGVVRERNEYVAICDRFKVMK